MLSGGLQKVSGRSGHFDDDDESQDNSSEDEGDTYYRGAHSYIPTQLNISIPVCRQCPGYSSKSNTKWTDPIQVSYTAYHWFHRAPLAIDDTLNTMDCMLYSVHYTIIRYTLHTNVLYDNRSASVVYTVFSFWFIDPRSEAID